MNTIMFSWHAQITPARTQCARTSSTVAPAWPQMQQRCRRPMCGHHAAEAALAATAGWQAAALAAAAAMAVAVGPTMTAGVTPCCASQRESPRCPGRGAPKLCCQPSALTCGVARQIGKTADRPADVAESARPPAPRPAERRQGPHIVPGGHAARPRPACCQKAPEGPQRLLLGGDLCTLRRAIDHASTRVLSTINQELDWQ